MVESCKLRHSADADSLVESRDRNLERLIQDSRHRRKRVIS